MSIYFIIYWNLGLRKNVIKFQYTRIFLFGLLLKLKAISSDYIILHII